MPRTLATIMLSALGVILGCSTVSEPSRFDAAKEPSAVNVATRQQELEQRAQSIASKTNALKPYSKYCDELMKPLEARKEALQNAGLLALIKDAETGSFSEIYNVQQAWWDYMDDVENTLKKCRENQEESILATQEAFLPTQEAQIEALSTIDAQRTLEETKAEEEAYKKGDQALAYAIEHDKLPPDYGEDVCGLMRQAEFSMARMQEIWNDGWWDHSWNAPNDDGKTQLAGNALILTLDLNLGRDFEGWCQSRFP